MILLENIQQAFANATSYPQLAQNLINIGVSGYFVDVSSGIISYNTQAGNRIIHAHANSILVINDEFSEAKTIEVIRENQQGKTTYPQFMQGIANAGVRFYEAVLEGENKRCIYVGIGGSYEEKIPL